MSDAIPLTPRPNLEQYKKLAKDLQRACKSNDPRAIRDWAAGWARRIAELLSSPGPREQAEHIAQRWREFQKGKEQVCKLSDAQFFLAREHGFSSWPKFAKHVESVSRANSPTANFEAAADAIVAGEVEIIRKLLRENPSLIRARSERDHHSTLLHYVSANGVEDFRQKTPKNIVAVAKLLLDTGAEVDAESEAYGGGSTTLGLVATSVHPERAGVQEELMQLLIDRGAEIDHLSGGGNRRSIVNACLANGRGKAAEFLAEHGAQLDLEGAAGVGRLDAMKQFFAEDGSLQTSATQRQLESGFAWACEYGRIEVVEFLLKKGIDFSEPLRSNGETGLHWAAFSGHAGIVKLLLEHGARVDVRDKTYDGTPLDWTLYAWNNSSDRHGRYYEVVRLLVRAGANWNSKASEHIAEKVRSDRRMAAAVLGEIAE